MPLFEVAIMELPSKKEAEEGTADEKLVFGPVFVTAKDGQSGAIRAIMENADKVSKIDKSRMSVLIRPFA